MKRRILLLLFFTVTILNISCAQIGLRGGINLSKFVGADVDNAENLMGLQGGISLQILNLGPLSIMPEIYYAEKGTRLKDQVRELQQTNPDEPVNPDNVDIEFNLAYVEIPVLAKLNLPFISTRVIRPYIAGGPVFGFRLDCSISLTNGAERNIEDCADENFSDLESTFNESDRGIVFVSGIDFIIPMLGALTLDGRYYKGLSRLREGGENSDVFNQNFTLMLGYAISF